MKYRRSTISILSLWLALLLPMIVQPLASGRSIRSEQDPQRPEVIKVPTAMVTVPVVVTDRYGQFVAGLSQNDFRLQENGVLQQIASFSTTEAPFNVALLIDTSRSTRNKLGAIRKAALSFIKQLQPNDRVLIVTFDEKVQFLGEFTSNRRDLERAIRSVKSSYLTSLYDAVHRTILEKMESTNGRKAIVALTDGVDTWSKLATYESTLELVSNTGVSSYAIQYETRNDGGSPSAPIFMPPRMGGLFSQGFAPTWAQSLLSSNTAVRTNMLGDLSTLSRTQSPPKRDRYLIASEYLRALAVKSGALYLRAESIESTSVAFSMIANELRHQYTLAYYPTNDKRDGALRKILVNVKGGDFSVRGRQGYRASTEEKVEEKNLSNPSKP